MLDRVHALGEFLVEPQPLFTPSASEAGLETWVSGEAQAATPRRVAGKNNALYFGFNAECEDAAIKFTGSNNIIYFGAYCRPAKSVFDIHGDNNIIYFGAFSSAVSIHIDVVGPGGSVVIGDDCMLSARIIMSNTDAHGIYDKETGNRINLNRDIFIDNHVWIARDVRINKGVRIGRDTVVGQGSVVVGELDHSSIYAGVPARKIREGVTWDRTHEDNLKAVAALRRSQERAQQTEALIERIRG